MSNTYIINKLEEETILEFFIRCCEENGFNVSKLIKYLKYLDTYMDDYINSHNGTISENMLMQIIEFGDYFIINYGEETREKRFTTFGVNDSFILNMYFNIKNEEMVIDADEIYASLTPVEQRKVNRIQEQLLKIDGVKSFIFLETDEETGEDLDPIVIVYDEEMEDEVKENTKQILRSEILNFFVSCGVILCIVNKDKKTPKDSENMILSIAFNDKNIALISARDLMKTLADINGSNDFINDLCVDGDLEFVDADLYINPLGQTRFEYNNLGEKLPSRKVKKVDNNIIPFSSVISRKK